jgi:hypothetical protein
VARPHLQGGFHTEITDVEHAAEDTTDNLVPLMVLEPDAEKWMRWSVKLGDFLRDVWTGRNERGQLQFKSFYFSATATAPQPQRAFDVIANAGALHPALLAWQRTGDKKLARRFARGSTPGWMPRRARSMGNLPASCPSRSGGRMAPAPARMAAGGSRSSPAASCTATTMLSMPARA